jgi:hypothetical protein
LRRRLHAKISAIHARAVRLLGLFGQSSGAPPAARKLGQAIGIPKAIVFEQNADRLGPATVAALHLRGVLHDPIGRLAVFAVGAIAVPAAYVAVVVMYLRIGAAVDQYGYGHVPHSEMPPIWLFERWGTAIDIVTEGVFVIGFFVAAYHARALGVAVGVKDYKRRFLWTVVTIFVPILCLFRPWLGLAEIRRGILNTAATGRPTAQGETSGLTVVLGISAAAWAGGTRAILRLASDHPQVTDPASFHAAVARIIGLMSGIGALEGCMLLVMATYLLTLHRPMRQLADNAAQLAAFAD